MLEVKEVTKIYGQDTAKVVALNNVSLTVDDGSFVAVMGPSGSGKSTLLNIIGGLESITSGKVTLGGKRIDTMNEDALVDIRRGEISYVFQSYHLLPSLTALENVLLPLLFRGEDVSESKALDILKRVGLGKRAEHKPTQLSGGEQQRVSIARALVHDPKLILADEPTGNMDQKTGSEILELFHEIHKDGRSIIMVTHDPAIAKHAERIVNLRDGQIAGLVENAQRTLAIAR